MSDGHHVGDIRLSQVLTSYGPGALIDFPRDAAIMGGVNHWPKKDRKEILEPRLRTKMASALGVPSLRLIRPPSENVMPWERGPRIKAFRFPSWFLADAGASEGKEDIRTRRLVPFEHLEGRLQYGGRRVVPVRFVTACARGHVADVEWRAVLPCKDKRSCKGKPIWLDERGSGGDLGDLVVRCQCGARLTIADLADRSKKLLGRCSGKRPWLRGFDESCDQDARLLIRTASNAYFAHTMSALSLPETKDPIAAAVERHWTDGVDSIEFIEDVETSRRFNKQWKRDTEGVDAAKILEAVEAYGKSGAAEIPVKTAEFASIQDAPDGYLEDLPPKEDFLARRLPNSMWRKAGEWPEISGVVQLHRLREVTALLGFTRFEAQIPDISGEYTGDVRLAQLDPEPHDFPAVENRGEGVFVELDKTRVDRWLASDPVAARIEDLRQGHERWREDRPKSPPFPGGAYILLHTLSHLLIQSLAMSCGYPATSIRERVYAEQKGYGILLYTASPDAEGTLGGLVGQARHLARHLSRALHEAELCSNDPICSQHEAGRSLEGRFLHGAACHGCSLIAETSCEMRNDFLDRALVVPVLGHTQAAYFGSQR